MSLIEAGASPIKAGASVADLLASHISPLGVLAALRHRDATGEGQHIDISMRDALAWTTQLSWPEGAPSLPESRRIACADGWIVAMGPEPPALAALGDNAGMTCADTLARLRAAGIAAAPVLELDALFRLPVCRARGLFLEADTPGGVPAPVLAAPYGLSQPVLRPGRSIPAPGADNGALVRGNA
jgi:crotonobetainyl-CoA:carnitine CoA-transferase CaiB-like acyl-CoA transferase